MNLRHFVLFGIISLLVSPFLMGCSVRLVPLDEAPPSYEEERAYYNEGYYRGEYGGPPPTFSQDIWHMSQYYQYVDGMRYGNYVSPPDRMNIDPNPNDKYNAGESPVRQAPTQRTAQSGNNRTAAGREESLTAQRAASRNRHASNTNDKERDVRQRLKRRRENERSTADEEREVGRRKSRRRAQR